MARSQPVSQPLKMNQRARIQSAIQERVRFRKVTGSTAKRAGATIFCGVAVVAMEPEDVGLSGGTWGKGCVIESSLSRGCPKNNGESIR